MFGSPFEKALDPELRAVFRTLPPIHTEQMHDDVSATRRVFQELADALPLHVSDDVGIEEQRIPGLGGASSVRLKIYRPKPRTATALPALLWIHGGGFILDNLAVDDFLCSEFVEAANCVVVSVGWRLAPEHPFPAGVDDCYTALIWVTEQASKLGIDTKRVALGGLSAGGGVCAGVTLMARDRGGPRVCFQMPLYACLDDRHITPSSYEVMDRRVWNRVVSLRAWKMYLGNGDAETVSPYAAPSRAQDLSGLPPAYMMTGQLDLIRDENMDYAHRLMQAGVPTELHVYPGSFHAFELAAPAAAVSQRAHTEYMEALKRALNPG